MPVEVRHFGANAIATGKQEDVADERRAYNVVAWTAVALMVALTIALVVISVRGLFD